MLVSATPSVSRAFRRRIEFTPNQVVTHRPPDLICGQSEAVWHQEQLLLLVRVADHEEARARVGRDSKQTLQDTANVFDVVANGGLPAKLPIDTVIPVTEIRRRCDR